jgi:hypothetical protein
LVTLFRVDVVFTEDFTSGGDDGRGEAVDEGDSVVEGASKIKNPGLNLR